MKKYLKIIMGGSQSTGSSLLVNILNRHSMLVAGPETYLFMHPKLYHHWEENKKYLIKTNKVYIILLWFSWNVLSGMFLGMCCLFMLGVQLVNTPSPPDPPIPILHVRNGRCNRGYYLCVWICWSLVILAYFTFGILHYSILAYRKDRLLVPESYLQSLSFSKDRRGILCLVFLLLFFTGIGLGLGVRSYSKRKFCSGV